MPLTDFDPDAFLSQNDDSAAGASAGGKEGFDPDAFLATPHQGPQERIKQLQTRKQSINPADTLSDDELREVMEHDLSQKFNPVDFAAGAAKGLYHLGKDLVTLPFRAAGEIGADAGENGFMAPVNAATSFASGAANTVIDLGRQAGKLGGGVAENVYALAGGTPLEAGTHTGYDSTDMTDRWLYAQGKLSKDQLFERYKQRYFANQGFQQTMTEHPNSVAELGAKIGQSAGLPVSDEQVNAAGKHVLPALSEAGALYAFGEVNKPAESAMRALGRPLGRVAGAATREATAFAAPKVQSALGSAASLAGRASEWINESKNLFNGKTTAGSVMGAVAGGDTGGAEGAILGALMGATGSRMLSLDKARAIINKGAEAAGVAEKMAQVAKQFAQKDAPFVRNLVNEMTTKAQAAKAAGNLAEAANLEGWASKATFAHSLIRDGVSGQSLFRHVAENAQRLGIDKGIARLALSLDRKPVRWAIEHGVPTAKAVIAGGTLNSILSIGQDATPEQMAEQFGMGGLAILGALGRASRTKTEGRLADFGRDLSMLHERLTNQLGDADLAKERVGQILAAYDPKTSGVDVTTFLRNMARMPDVTFRFVDNPGEAAGRYYDKDANGNRFMDINLSANRTRTALSDMFGHESGHAVAEYLREKQPGVWGEFTRSAQGSIDAALLDQAKREYITLLHHNELQGKTPQDAANIVEQRLQEKELSDPEYFMNELFADRVADAYTSRDTNRLSQGSRGGAWERFLSRKGIAQVAGSQGAHTRALQRIVGNSKLNALAEKALGEYLSPNRFLSDSVPVKQFEKGEKVEMNLNEMAAEAFARAKERNPGQPVNLEFDWGTITEQNGQPVITPRSPKDIRADEKQRLQAALAYAQTLKSTEASGWGKGVDEKGGVTFGGGKVPQQFLDALQQWGYKQSTVDIAKDIANKIGTGDVVKLWYNALTTTLSAGFWRKLIRGEKVGFKRSQREFVPAEIKITSKGNILVGGWDVKVLDLRIQDWAEKGLLEPWGNNTEAVHRDLLQWLANWKDGKPGETGLGTAKKNVLNALVIGKGRKADTGANPYRDALANAEAAGTFRTFRLDRIEDVQTLNKTGYHFDYQKAQGNALPDSIIDKDAMDKMKVRYDGRIEVPGVERHQFTIENPESPAHKATFIVRGEPTPEAVQARIAEKEAQFAEGRALPDDFEAEHIQAEPKKPEDPRIIARLLGVHYDGRVEGGDLPAHQYTTQDGKKLIISGTPSLDRVREKMQGRALPDEMEVQGMYGEEAKQESPALVGARLGLRYEGRVEGGSLPAHQYRDENGKRIVVSGAPTIDTLRARLGRALPEKFWLSPDGEVINNRDYDRSDLAHDKTAQALLKSRYNEVVDDPDEAFKALTMKGFRRGVWHKGTDQVYITEPLPNKAMLSVKQGEALEAMAAHGGYRIDIDSQVKPRNLYDYSFGGGRALPDEGDSVELFRAATKPEAGTGAHFTDDVDTATAYTDNPGYGGPNIYRYKVKMENPLELSQSDARDIKPLARAYAEITGDDFYDVWEKWKDDGYDSVFSVLENARGVQDTLAENHDWIRFKDDYPENATTWKYLRGDKLNPEPEGRALPDSNKVKEWNKDAQSKKTSRSWVSPDGEIALVDRSHGSFARYYLGDNKSSDPVPELVGKGWARLNAQGNDLYTHLTKEPTRKQRDALIDVAMENGLKSVIVDSERFGGKGRVIWEAGRALPDVWKINISGKELEFVPPKKSGAKIVMVKTDAFDNAFQKDAGFYIAPNGEGEIKGRREGFRDFMDRGLYNHQSGKHEKTPIETPYVNVDKNGVASFINGRHRYSVLRDDLKAKSIPVAFDSNESLRNAKRLGLVVEEKSESRRERTQRLKSERVKAH